jgi:signal transduction histidine kinase/ligand-binding sensor domain-containing protein/CheY-like chemotaxis protein/AraC-like DNA-binding protein
MAFFKKILLFTFPFFVIGLPMVMSGQVEQMKYARYTIDNGLSQNMVQAVLEDRQGFMWFGTKDGLNRFDGHNFLVYRNEPGNAKSLSNNDITAIYEDKAGNLWIGTQSGGLNLFDRQTNSFYVLPEVAVQDNISGARWVISIDEDNNGDIWVTNYNAVFRLRFNNLKNRLIPGKNGISGMYKVSTYFQVAKNQSNYIYNNWLLISKAGFVYVTQNNAFYKSDQSLYTNREPHFSRILNQRGNKIIEDHSGNIWFSSTSGISMYNPVSGKIRFYTDPKLRKPNFTGITLGPDGKLWFKEWEGAAPDHKYLPVINYFDPSNETFGTAPGKEEFSCFVIYFASRDILWMGTPGLGVVKFNMKALQFKLRPETVIEAIKKKNLELVYIFYQNNAYAFVKKKGGKTLLLYNWVIDSIYPADKAFKLIPNSSMPGFRIYLPMTRQAYIRRNGDIWGLGANFNDLVKIDPAGNVLKTISLANNISLVFFEDRKSRLWVGNRHGTLLRLNDKEEGVIEYKYNPKSEFREELQVYLDDAEGNLWLGTKAGLIKYDPISGKSTFLPDPDKSLSTSILTLCPDPVHPDEILWAGTDGAGLLKINKRSGIVQKYLVKDGLPNEVVYAIIADSHNNLWMSTNNGIAEFNPATGSFSNFKKEDGLQSNEFNRLSYSKLQDGTMVFGGIYGTNYFKPESITRDTTPPQIAFTGFKIFNKPVHFGERSDFLSNPIEFTENITLPWEQNMINLDFTAFDFAAPDLVNYSWKMEGIDRDWINAGNSHTATYANLSPGHYTFRLRAANSAGYWNQKGVSLAITILPPWWRTWWAYSVYVLAFIAAIAGVFRFRLNRLRLHDALKQEQQEARRLQEVDEIKTRFFSNITHEFRTPLTLILGPVEHLLKKVKDKEQKDELTRINRNARQLLRLINQLLDLNKLEGHNMKIEQYSVEAVQYVHDIIESFKSGAELKKIELELHANANQYHISFDTDKLQKILDNLLSNALKFTPEGGTIDVILEKEIKSETQLLNIRVKDTGIGISPEQLGKIFDRFYQADGSATRKEQGTGIGLSLVKELLDLLGGTVIVQSEPGKGTEFSISLPVTPIDASFAIEKVIEPENTDRMLPLEYREETLEEQYNHESEKPLILVIEDNPDMRDFIRNCLKDQHSVVVAENGIRGLDAAFEHIPDLIISDVMMPGKDGFEVTEILKQDERSSHIPVILLTAKTALESRLKGLKTKADVYLAKPFNTEELLLNIENQINIRKQLRTRYNDSLHLLNTGNDSHHEDKFILKLRAIMQKHIEEVDFGVEGLCFEAAMSRTQLHRKIKALTGNNTTWFIKKVRLEHALELLKSGDLSVSEIAYTVGFNTPNYFSKCFQDFYGYAPSEVKKQDIRV